MRPLACRLKAQRPSPRGVLHRLWTVAVGWSTAAVRPVVAGSLSLTTVKQKSLRLVSIASSTRGSRAHRPFQSPLRRAHTGEWCARTYAGSVAAPQAHSGPWVPTDTPAFLDFLSLLSLAHAESDSKFSTVQDGFFGWTQSRRVQGSCSHTGRQKTGKDVTMMLARGRLDRMGGLSHIS